MSVDLSLKVEVERPEDSEVFATTSGEKVRIEFDKVFSYIGKSKSNSTTIEYGYGYDGKESFILDIDFDTFDAKLTSYKKELKKYWASREDYYD